MSASSQTQVPYSVERSRRAVAAEPSLPGLGFADPVDTIGTRLDAIQQEIETLTAMVGSLSSDIKDDPALSDIDVQRDVRVEVARMVREIGRAKREIVAIRDPLRPEHRVETASQQLEAIVTTTEEATNDILASVDAVDAILALLRVKMANDTEAVGLIEDASQLLTRMIETCSFQDLTGQRISQVVQVLRFIEQRIVSMIDIWGLDAFQDLPTEESEDRNPDDDLLNGPQLDGKGLSQDDVDALFD